MLLCVQMADLNSKISDMESGINRQQYEASEVKVQMYMHMYIVYVYIHLYNYSIIIV